MLGIRIAREGKSALKAKPQDLVLDSSLQTLPIALQQSFQVKIPAGGNQVSTSIPHGLTFAPIFRAWIDDCDLSVNPAVFSGKRLYLPVVTSTSFVARIKSDLKNVAITISSTSGGYTADRDLTFNGYLYVFSKRFQ